MEIPAGKQIRFMGGSLDSIRQFPKQAQQLAGRELRLVQQGALPEDWKPMPTIGQGAFEIRIHEPHEHRIIYVAKFPEAIYVLHAFGATCKGDRMNGIYYLPRDAPFPVLA